MFIPPSKVQAVLSPPIPTLGVESLPSAGSLPVASETSPESTVVAQPVIPPVATMAILTETPTADHPTVWVAPAKPALFEEPLDRTKGLLSYDDGVVETGTAMKTTPFGTGPQPPITPTVPAPDLTLATIEGSDYKDFLLGTAASEILYGYGANDFIMALDGDDIAFGGADNDVLFGGGGNDTLYGEEGDDSLEGGLGDDLLYGGAGNDILYGGAGLNTLTGGEGSDTFRLGALAGDELLEYATLGPVADGFSVVTDFDASMGDVLNFSLVLLRDPFAALASPDELALYISFQQVEADSHVLITTPQGTTTLEALLLNVEAASLTPNTLVFTPPSGPLVE